MKVKAHVPVVMTSEQREQMRKAMRMDTIESTRRMIRKYDAIMLWTAHLVFGAGGRKLREYWYEANKMYLALLDEMQLRDISECNSACEYLLRQAYGIDFNDLTTLKYDPDEVRQPNKDVVKRRSEHRCTRCSRKLPENYGFKTCQRCRTVANKSAHRRLERLKAQKGKLDRQHEVEVTDDGDLR